MMMRIPAALAVIGLAVALVLPTSDAVAQRDQMYEDAVRELGISQSGVGGDDVYVVVPGDTLWHICTRFFDDPEYWPTLWSLNNEELANPHYIYPGQILRFRPGTDIRAPALVLGDVDDLSFDENFEPIVHFLSTTTDCELAVPFADISGDVTLSSTDFMSRSPGALPGP